jgi:hypothetical protein
MYNPGAISQVVVMDENKNSIIEYAASSTIMNYYPDILEIDVIGVNIPVRSLRMTVA